MTPEQIRAIALESAAKIGLSFCPRWGLVNEPVGNATFQHFAEVFLAAITEKAEPVAWLKKSKRDGTFTATVLHAHQTRACFDECFPVFTHPPFEQRNAHPEPAPQQKSPEEVQWRNIRYVVRTLADWAFGSKDDPRWGSAWVAMVNGLTAKDGPEFQLERLPIDAAPLPDKCECLTLGPDYCSVHAA